MRDRDRPDAPTGSVSDRPVQRRAGAGLTVGRLGELPRPPLVDAPAERRASPTVGPTASPTTTPLADPFFYCPTLGGDVVQARGDLGPDADRVRAEAAAGVAGPGQALPHGDAIARSFGPAHELSSVRAHVGGAAATAAAAIGATAYATGADVAFAAPPDLHTAAHEAAHVVQQRAGVHLAGGVGADGDPYERHADAVADRVVAGESAADLLSPTGGAATTGAAVQRAPRPGGARDAEARAATKVELTGLASVYRLYQRYRETHGLEIAYAANTISDGSELLRDTTQSDALSRQLEAALPAYGFATIRDFEAKIAQYERDFEAGAAEVVFALLDRYTAQLSAEAARLRDPGAVRALHGQLGGFRGHQQAQEQAVGDHQRVVMSMQFGCVGRGGRVGGRGGRIRGGRGRRVARGGVEGRGGSGCVGRQRGGRGRGGRCRGAPAAAQGDDEHDHEGDDAEDAADQEAGAGRGGGGRGGRRRHRGDVARDGGGGRGAGVGLHLGGLPGRPALREFVALGRAEAARALAGADRRLVREASDQQRLEFAAAVARRVLAVEEVVDRLAPRQPRGLPAPAPPRAGDRGSAAVRKGYPGAHLTAGMAVD
jgi:hypothetical protein